MKSVAIVLQSPIGRSDPQAIYLANSLSTLGIKVLMVQCIHLDSIKRPYNLLHDSVETTEFYPRIPMWTSGAVIEFSFYAANKIQHGDIDTVFCFDYTGILTCALLEDGNKWNGNICIFMLENIEYMTNSHGHDSLVALKKIWRKSIIVYPEPNRLIMDSAKHYDMLGIQKNIYVFPATCPSKTANSYNNQSSKYSKEENLYFKIIYAGSVVNESYIIDFAKFICENDFSHQISLDIFGPFGPGCKNQIEAIVGSSRGKVQYFGIVNQDRLSKIYPEYHFSLVAWRPAPSNFYFASPNKFFQSIQHRVIPITTMHPLVAAAVNEFGLSVVKLDWEQVHWKHNLENAFSHSGELDNWANNNYEIFAQSMSWDVEFADFYAFICRCIAHPSV